MPKTRYARSRGVDVAYQVVGEGPSDLIYLAGWVTNVEAMWEDPGYARFLNRLASFSRLIVYDKRGVGLSDPMSIDGLRSHASSIADPIAVMDAVGSTSATLFGHSEGGATAVRLAATHPDRVEKLILTGAFARRLRSDEYPWAPTLEQREAEARTIRETWPDSSRVADHYAPSRAGDPAFVEWLSHYLRMSASPGTGAALHLANSYIDVVDLLPEVRAPTLCLYRLHDSDVNVAEGRFIADRIPNARMVELAGADHLFWAGDPDQILFHIEQFVTGRSSTWRPERVVSTVLFTDIVGSTAMAASLGDRAWRDTLHRHDGVIRRELEIWNGRMVKATGDGVLAIFDSPSQAIRFAQALPREMAAVGVEVRCGVHTGEVEILQDDVAGLAVHIAARISALAGPSEVLVSRTVKDLVGGSGFDMNTRGVHTLKGVPDRWEIFSVEQTG